MQIGPIKYSKKEEKVFFKSVLLGLLVGLPLGLLLAFTLGFPPYPSSFEDRLISSLLFIGSVESIPLLISTLLSLLYFKKGRLLNSWRDVAKLLWGLFLVFPVLLIYIALLMSALIYPLYDATFWLSPIRKYWLGALVFLPFLFLFMLIFLPDQKPRKLMIRLWLVMKGEARLPKLDVRSAITTLLIFLWLLLIFLPLPNVALVNLVLIAGGVLVVTYLARQRYQMRRK
jgi:hypothetical protein